MTDFIVTVVETPPTIIVTESQGPAGTQGGPPIYDQIDKSINYTLTSSDYCISYTLPNLISTLPTAIGVRGKVYVIDNASTGEHILNTYGTETIQGQLTQTLPSNTSITIISNNANWRII